MKLLAFDMDGDLVDSRDAILRSLDVALQSNGFHAVPDVLRNVLVGPPLISMIKVAIGNDKDIDPLLVQRIANTYRSINDSEGMNWSHTFPGIRTVLQELSIEYRLVVATSKAATSASKLLTHLGLNRYFDVIDGSTSDLNPESKITILNRIINNHGCISLMIGDRVHDVEAAGHHGIQTIGVAWGYAGIGELERAGAARIVFKPDQLVTAIRELISSTI